MWSLLGRNSGWVHPRALRLRLRLAGPPARCHTAYSQQTATWITESQSINTDVRFACLASKHHAGCARLSEPQACPSSLSPLQHYCKPPLPPSGQCQESNVGYTPLDSMDGQRLEDGRLVIFHTGLSKPQPELSQYVVGANGPTPWRPAGLDCILAPEAGGRCRQDIAVCSCTCVDLRGAEGGAGGASCICKHHCTCLQLRQHPWASTPSADILWEKTPPPAQHKHTYTNLANLEEEVHGLIRAGGKWTVTDCLQAC